MGKLNEIHYEGAYDMVCSFDCDVAQVNVCFLCARTNCAERFVTCLVDQEEDSDSLIDRFTSGCVTGKDINALFHSDRTMKGRAIDTAYGAYRQTVERLMLDMYKHLRNPCDHQWTFI